jgi:hypothetical protein
MQIKKILNRDTSAIIDAKQCSQFWHSPASFKYTSDNKLAHVKHCCHAMCSYELWYSYPKRGEVLIDYLKGDLYTSVTYENKQVYNKNGQLIRTSFRKSQHPENVVHYYLKYDRDGNLIQIDHRWESPIAVYDEVWAEIILHKKGKRVISRDVLFRTECLYFDFTCRFDEFGRLSNWQQGNYRKSFFYNSEAAIPDSIHQ